MDHRVLIVHNEYLQPGGEDIAVRAEAALLREAGVKVHEWVTSNRDLGLESRTSRLRTAVECVWSQRNYSSLRSEVQRFRPTVMHCHNLFPLPSPSAYYAARAEGVPVIQTLHNYRLMCLNATFTRSDKPCFSCLGRSPVAGVVHRCYRGSLLGSAASAAQLVVHRTAGTWRGMVDRYVALTPVSRKLFIRGGFPGETIKVKPNFVEPDPGRGEHRDRFVLFVGRLSAEKGVGVLLDAWRSFSDGIQLRVIGSGEMAPMVRDLAAEDRRIAFLEELPRAQVIEHMKRARLLVVPSLWNEGLPFVALEAMAVGLPILCSNVENLEDVVVRDGAGWSFQAGSSEGLQQMLRAVWDDNDGVSEKSAGGRRLYLSKYTAPVNLRGLLAVYDSVASNPARGCSAVPST